MDPITQTGFAPLAHAMVTDTTTTTTTTTTVTTTSEDIIPLQRFPTLPDEAHIHDSSDSSPAISRKPSSVWLNLSDSNGPTTPSTPPVGVRSNEGSTAEILARVAEQTEREMVLPPMDTGRQAWTFVASAFVLETLVFGFGFTYGIFQAYYTSNPPFNTASPAAISAIGTVALAIQYVEVLLVIMWCRRYPDWVKTMMWCSLGLSFVSLFLSSFATKVWQLIILQGILPGIGGGGLYTPVILWLSEWFNERRGLAGGIIFGGSGIGGFVFPLIISGLLEKVGYEWTLRIWSFIMVTFSGLALLGARPRLPVFKPRGRRPPLFTRNIGFLKNPLFLCVAMIIFIQALGYFPVSLYMPTYVTALGRPVFEGTLVLSSFNAASVVGQIAFGHLCDMYSFTTVMIGSSIGSALAAFLLWGFARNLSMVLVFVIIFGGLSGGFSSTWPHASLESAGSDLNQAGIIFGFFGASKGISAVAGPLIAGILHRPQDSRMPVGTFGNFGFGRIEIFVGGMMVASAVGAGIAAWIRVYYLGGGGGGKRNAEEEVAGVVVGGRDRSDRRE